MKDEGRWRRAPTATHCSRYLLLAGKEYTLLALAPPMAHLVVLVGGCCHRVTLTTFSHAPIGAHVLTSVSTVINYNYPQCPIWSPLHMRSLSSGMSFSRSLPTRPIGEI